MDYLGQPVKHALCRSLAATSWYQFLPGDATLCSKIIYGTFAQRKSRRFMKSGKVICLIFALSLSLLWPRRLPAQSQEEQPAVEAPTQTTEVEIHPLASVLTVMNIPARAALCGLNSWLASIVMFFSAGMRYADAAKMMEEGCSGPWVITPEMLEESRPVPPLN